jgi:phage I-like protein
MNHLILNRDFRLPEDGWYQIAPLGEFPHNGAGVVQVIDQEACVAMAARFAADANTSNFPGLLVDFDHFSLDGEKRSEAAGWIVALEARAAKADGSDGSDTTGNAQRGLWAQIRWSDLGEEAVKGGRYRFLSPVWARSDCVDLGNGRVRPVRLLNAAVTNDPNLKGMRPLSNRSQEPEFRSQHGEVEQKTAGTKDESVDSVTFNRAKKGEGEKSMKVVIERLVNHLGLVADATEAVILEKMAGLPALTAVSELQNSLKLAQDERDALKGTLKNVEGELVNRHLAEFEGVVTETTKGFWTEQLVANRAGALIALGDLKTVAESGKGQAAGGKQETAGAEAGAQGGTKKPLHNRATARPVPPGQGGGPSTGSGQEGDGKAAKIRNRAHEIVAAEKIPFIVAFRRAEREGAGQ